MRKLGALLGSVALVSWGALGVTATASATAADAGSEPLDRAPLADGTRFWVNPDNRAARQAAVWEDRGHAYDAALLRRIADTPVAEWITDREPRDHVRDVTGAAADDGGVPVLVAYNIPHRDCGLHSGGGAGDGAAYRAWIGEVAAGIGDRRAVVVLEPDAIAQLVAGCAAAGYGDRLELLAEAVTTLKALPGTTVYLDAGNPGWITDPDDLTGPLEEAGIARADGFALNVSNFHTTAVNRSYGERLSRALGGKHFVIDTSRNGNGPLFGGGFAEPWCNPPDRALGEPPTTATGDETVDAYLWIKKPGESDGACRGAPAAGQWWSSYALELARGQAEIEAGLNHVRDDLQTDPQNDLRDDPQSDFPGTFPNGLWDDLLGGLTGLTARVPTWPSTGFPVRP